MNDLKLDGLELMIKRTKSTIERVDKEIEVCQKIISDAPTEAELSILIGHKKRRHKFKEHLVSLKGKYETVAASNLQTKNDSF